MKYYDVTVPLADKMVTWPTDPRTRVTPFKSVKRGDGANVLKLELGTHAGSHVDSPKHFGFRQTVDELALRDLIGPARVVTVRSKDLVRLSDLKGVDLRKVKRVLFKTRNSKRIGDGKFHRDFVALSPEVAVALGKHRVRVVGTDGMSVDPMGEEPAAHFALLGSGAVLIENINLTGVPAGEYELICLPLKLIGGDGAPARVVLRKP